MTHMNLKKANMAFALLHEADLTGADLRGANLNRAEGVTCEQIKSAVIDENTRFPDYISLTGSSGTVFKCESIVNKN